MSGLQRQKPVRGQSGKHGEDEYAAKNSGGVHMRGMQQPERPRDQGKRKASLRREPTFQEPLGRQAQQRFGTNEQRFDRPEDRSEMDSIRTMSENDPEEIEWRHNDEERREREARGGFGAAFD